ncbi:glycosyltransferase [Bdellovibrionota bacterium FG-2]
MNQTAFNIDQLAVVLFAYNENGNLLRLLQALNQEISKISPRTQVQFAICVQGNQETLDEVLQFKDEMGDHRRLNYHYSPLPVGVAGAAVKAFELVEGEPTAFLMMDCDLNHQPEELSSLFRLIQPRTVVVGSRYVAGGEIIGMPLWKKTLSKWVNAVLSVFLRLPVADKTSGYRLITGTRVIEIAKSVQGKGFDFYIEFLVRLWLGGFNIVETPITFKVRTIGQSKMRIFRTVNYLRLKAKASLNG